jgi:hypothetical protein
VRLDVRAVDHLDLTGSALFGKDAEQSLPNTAFCPTHKAIVDRLGWTIFRRAIAPPATTLDDKDDPTNHPPVVHPLLAAHIRRQQGLNRNPLVIA